MKSGGNSYGSGTEGKEGHRSQYNRYMADQGKSPKDHMNMNVQFQQQRSEMDEDEELEEENEKSNVSDGMPKMRLLDRSQLMDMMLFPQNSKKMVIIPSNKEGTGFLNHCYDKQFLTGFITEKEFNAIVLICSRIAARAYSQK